MANLCIVLFLALAVANFANAAKDIPTTKLSTTKTVPTNTAAAAVTDQKNVMTFGRLGNYNGIGDNDLPVGGYGGKVGLYENFPMLSGPGGTGGAVGYGGPSGAAGGFTPSNGLGFGGGGPVGGEGGLGFGFNAGFGAGAGSGTGAGAGFNGDAGAGAGADAGGLGFGFNIGAGAPTSP